MENYLDKLRSIEKLHNVSRETFTSLEEFATLLVKWNTTINLVSKSTINDLWQRHIMDSAQLVSYLPDRVDTLTDFGSGGGFPGCVLSLLGVKNVHLIESDIRKASFLREATRLSKETAHIHNDRIENLAPWTSDVITARALAPMNSLLSLVEPFIGNHTVCLFLKGKQLANELEIFRKYWHADESLYPSITAPDAYVVRLKNIKRRALL